MTDKILGLKRGEGIPHERHGEPGVLYRPRTQLNGHEMMLMARVNVVCGDGDGDVTRDTILDLVNKVAAEMMADTKFRPRRR